MTDEQCEVVNRWRQILELNKIVKDDSPEMRDYETIIALIDAHEVELVNVTKGR